MTTEQLSGGLERTGPWAPFPKIDDRAAWQAVRKVPRLALSVDAILNYAEQVMTAEIDQLSGTMYMEFMRSGNRLQYEQNYFRRRAELSHLVMAECLTAESRYLDRIIDYIWAILGEIYWCIPAHNFAGQHDMVMHKRPNPWHPDDPLPIPDDEYLDLFNCETAAILAEACYLLGPVLQEQTPSLYHLVHREIERHTFARLESQVLFGWYHGKNNWTPWCAHNLLLAATYVIDDHDRLVTLASKLMVPMQRFFDNLEDSGSCIEGPSYWVVSAGRLAGFIELVESRFGVRLGFEHSDKFRAFGSHIACLHIGENQFVNFADGAFKVDLDHGLLAHYAQMIGNETLAGLVSEDIDRVALRKLDRPVAERHHNEYNRQTLVHLTRLMFWTPNLPNRAGIKHECSVWLSDMEVLIARENEHPGKGLMLSVIAGTNDPKINHHSHNDVGHFSVCLNGWPMIIDLGQGAYSKATFGEARYDMWHISSEGHNVPRVNGILQRPGAGAEAREVTFRREGTVSTLILDAAPSYFAEAKGRQILRQIAFDHGSGRIEIEDHIELPEGLSSFELPLHIVDCEVSSSPSGALILSSEAGQMEIGFSNLDVACVETINLTDPRHSEVWGPRVKRILLRAGNPVADHFTQTISIRALPPRKTSAREGPRCRIKLGSDAGGGRIVR
ncbi:heparinase II/III domain-containing protein [Roseinatronobacter alkalisoli]|nr:heparinase II/III family protein [Roseinatronobacter sp. HJB301]